MTEPLPAISTNHPTTVHLLSDRSGGTLDLLWPAIKTRFRLNGFTVRKYHRADGAELMTESELEEYIKDIINTPGRNVVYYTLENEARASLLRTTLNALKIECVDPLAEAVAALAKTSGQTPASHPLLDEDQARIDNQMAAMRFWQEHDDGAQLEDTFRRGHLLLLGGSRTGKTGGSAILAMNGFFVGNDPFAEEIANPERMKALIQAHPNMLVVGLVRDVSDLSIIRRNRMRIQLADPSFPEGYNPARWAESEERYFGQPAVARERRAFERYCAEAGVKTVIDVTRCQPEEVAARIMAATGLEKLHR